MKKVANFIILLTVLFFTIPTVQATDQQGLNYASLKDEYIKNHPGQAIIPYPWVTSTAIKVLPFNYDIPADPANNFSIAAGRNQFESATFIINAQKDLSGINIFVPNLYNARGNSIPADAINVRTVKVWYQSSDAPDGPWTDAEMEYILTPELLLKDDSLVNVDYVNKTNYLKVTIDGNQQYIDISNPSGTFPSNAQIHDASSLQPFALKANENKQIWLTIHVPSNTSPGEYYGDITITTPSETPVKMNFSVTVLPFELEPSPIEYSLYYMSMLPSTAIEEAEVGINSEWKTPQQYSIELQNMKDHGVLYPTIYQWGGGSQWSGASPYIQTLNLALSLRNQTGFPTDHIFLGLTTGNSTNKTDLSKLEYQTIQWKNITSHYGYRDIYIYGIDEAVGDVLRSERTAWQTVHTAGAKVYASFGRGNLDAVDIVGDLLDVAVVDTLNATLARQWHSYGKRIFSYGNPQVGVENPEIYRKNYGFTLWNTGYDGAMDFAYQYKYGQSIWNDYDSGANNYRDHVFAYPTSNGVIDTIQWEGWREGVDDTRYLATLIKLEGNDTSSRAIISDSLSKGEDMATIREKIIERILVSSLTNTDQPTIGIFRNGVFYLRNSNSYGAPNFSFAYGATGDVPVVGDWEDNDIRVGQHCIPGTPDKDYPGYSAVVLGAAAK